MPSSKDPVINRQKAKEYRLAHPEWHRESNRLWARKKRAQMPSSERAETRNKYKRRNPEHHLVQIAERRAKALGVPFDISASDISVPEHCPILGIKLVWGYGNRGWRNTSSPSLDRIKPQLGYVKGNVRVISMRANHVKGNATITELEAVLAYMKREGGNWDLAEQDARCDAASVDSPQLAFGW